MLKNLRATFGALGALGALGAVGFALIACTVGTVPGSSGSSGSTEPEQQVETTSTSGLKVTANIASVSLGDECEASLRAPSAGDCAVGGCGGGCQRSNVQIAFNAGPGSNGASVEVVSVTLMDAKSGELIDTLTASKPEVWNGNGYTAWDQKVSPGGDLKASYDLTSPAWSKIDGTSTSRSSGSYSRTYRLNLTLRIDGVQVILQSVDLNRQPQAVT